MVRLPWTAAYAGDSIDKMFEGAVEAIQLPDDDGVALPCVGQSFGQAAPVIFGTARRVIEKRSSYMKAPGQPFTRGGSQTAWL